MNKYFRITGYIPKKDIGFIMDSYGKFDELWQFSSCMVQHGFKILAVGNSNKFLNGNFENVATPDTENMICRAVQKGMPQETTFDIDGITYKAYQVQNKIYIPDRWQIV